MVVKTICVVLFASIIYSGYALREIRLEDQHVRYISHPILGRGIGIQKDFWDTLRYCHVIFPDGARFEAYPNYNIPDAYNVYFSSAVLPFTSCAIGFRGVGVEFSGIYELLSTVLHSSDQSLSLTRQRFNITVVLPTEN